MVRIVPGNPDSTSQSYPAKSGKGSMGKKKEKHLRKLDRLKDMMQAMVDEEFTGHVKINFTQGGIGRIEKMEEVLREE